MGTNFSSHFLKPEHRRSTKCYIAVNSHLKEALLDVVHDEQYGIKRDPEELYKFFNRKENVEKINKLEEKRVLSQDQIDLLYQQNQRTFSDKWDITLICILIINFTSLKPPTTGWKKQPAATDTSTGAFVVRARRMRNLFNHSTLTSFAEENDFRAFFDETRDLVVGLNYKDIAEFDKLDNDAIDQTVFTN